MGGCLRWCGGWCFWLGVGLLNKPQNFQVDFDRWITSGENLFQARRLADILATVMNLPVDEKKNDPIFELEGQKKLSGEASKSLS